jgi:hypothetical protein
MVTCVSNPRSFGFQLSNEPHGPSNTGQQGARGDKGEQNENRPERSVEQFFTGTKQAGNRQKKHPLLLRLRAAEILRLSSARPERANVRRADGQNSRAPSERNPQVPMTRSVAGGGKQRYIGDSIRKLVEKFSRSCLAPTFDSHQTIQQVRKQP